MEEINMSEQVTSGKRRVSIGGAEAFDQTVQLNKKLKIVKFEPSKCYYRTLLKTYKRTVPGQNGPETEYPAGIPSRWMFQEMFGQPVKDEYLGNERGIEIPLEYATKNAKDFLTKILAFETIEDKYFKPAMANFLRYLTVFSKGYKFEDEDDKDVMFFAGLLSETEEELNDPNYDADTAILAKFKASANEVPKGGAQGTLMAIAELTARKAIARWALDNTDIKMAYTYTGNANFDGVGYWGSIEPKENDGGEQFDQVAALGSLGRAVAQQNYIKSGASGGADPTSKAFFESFNNWLNLPKQNNNIMSTPNPNGVVFLLSQECVSGGDKLVPGEGGSEPSINVGIMNWSSKKTEKIEAERNTGIVFTDPDVCHAVLKFNVGSDPASAGKDMGVGSWSGKKFMPYDKVAALMQETFLPTIGDRINNYKPFDLQGCLTSFKKYWLEHKPYENMTEEELQRHQKAIDLFMAKQTAADIAGAINATATAGGVDMGIGISLTDETPQAVQTPNPTPTPNPMPTPTPTPKVG